MVDHGSIILRLQLPEVHRELPRTQPKSVTARSRPGHVLALSKSWARGISPRLHEGSGCSAKGARAMEAGIAPRRRDRLAKARRDLQADWRRWSPAERVLAVAGGAVLGLAPLLALSRSLVG
jgi:hypothetical protein